MSLSDLLHPVPLGGLDGKLVEQVADLPSDERPVWEGDDSVHQPGSDAKPVLGALLAADARRPPRVVPFAGVLKRGSSGGAVVAVQRALGAAGFRRARASGWYGPGTVANVKAFQRSRGIETTGGYGKRTHRALLPYFDRYGAWLMTAAWQAEEAGRLRARIVATALFALSEHGKITYSQGPDRLNAVKEHLRPPRFPRETDCSGMATWIYEAAGAPDPCGGDYDVRDLHYTGTLATHGREASTPGLGDVLIYGPRWPYQHAVVYIGGGRCVSFGGPGGPNLLDVHYRPDLARIRSYV